MVHRVVPLESGLSAHLLQKKAVCLVFETRAIATPALYLDLDMPCLSGALQSNLCQPESASAGAGTMLVKARTILAVRRSSWGQ